MSDKRFRFGVISSLIWLFVMASLLWIGRSDAADMTPNEWGDFFAGIFAPLAFLWLVLGYLQQGEELRLSTRALLLQAKELENSVTQQRELVEVTREQVISEREALSYERRLREEAVKPTLLIVGAGGMFHEGGYSIYRLNLSNTGATATGVSVEVIPKDGELVSLLETPLLQRGERLRLTYARATPLKDEDTRLRIRYKDTMDRDYEAVFLLRRESDELDSQLVLFRIEI